MAYLFSNVGDRLLQLLQKNNIRQIQLSQKTGLSANAISSYIRNLRIPDTEASYKIAKALGVTMEWLLTGEGNMDFQETGNSPPWALKDYQKDVAEKEFGNLLESQVALINAYEKLLPEEKEEIWLLIDHKLKKRNLSSNSPTSKDGNSGSKTA